MIIAGRTAAYLKFRPNPTGPGPSHVDLPSTDTLGTISSPGPAATTPASSSKASAIVPGTVTTTPPPVAARSPKDPEQIFGQNATSVAFIKGKVANGSGLLVAPNLVATNSHVVGTEFARNLEVHFPSAGSTDDKGPFQADLVYEDVKRDLAFITVRSNLPPLSVAETFEFHAGMSITIFGSPSAVSGTVLKNAISTGVLGTKDRRMDQDYYQLSASVNPGNSGGPVFDKFGEVIGIATLKASRQETIAWCIPVEDLRLGISKVRSQSQDASNDAGDNHRLRVLFLYLTVLAQNFSDGATAYNSGMNDAAKQGKQPMDGVNAVARIVHPRRRSSSGSSGSGVDACVHANGVFPAPHPSFFRRCLYLTGCIGFAKSEMHLRRNRRPVSLQVAIGQSFKIFQNSFAARFLGFSPVSLSCLGSIF